MDKLFNLKSHYYKRSTFILFGNIKQDENMPIALKICPLNAHKNNGFSKKLFHSLESMCPHVIKIYSDKMASAEDSEIKYLFSLDSKISDEYKHCTYPIYIEVMEKIASKFTIGSLTPRLGQEMILSLSFQMIWTMNCLLYVGYIHGDFYSRNIWLQPIKPVYKYLIYKMPYDDNIYYLPLSSTGNYIIKVGDYGESKYTRYIDDVIDSLNQLTYELKRIHSPCLDMVENRINTLKDLHKISDKSPISDIFNESIFSIFKKVPDDLTNENSITPNNYYNPDIIGETPVS